MNTETINTNQLKTMSDKDVRLLFDVPFPHQEQFTTAKDIYLTTNEDFLTVAQTLHDEERKGKFTYVGILGGIDSSLTHLVQIHQPKKERTVETAVLTDINESAIEYGQFRLDLLKVCKNPIEYLQAIIPAKIDYASIAADEKDPIKIADKLDKMSFLLDPSMMIKKMRELGYSPLKIAGLIKNMAESHNGFYIRISARKIDLHTDIRHLIGQALATKDHWLSTQNPENYQTAQQLNTEKTVRIIKMPLQQLGESPLGKALQSGQIAPLGYLSCSNVGGIMSDEEFAQFKTDIHKIEHSQDIQTEVIYGVNGTNSKTLEITQEIDSSDAALNDQELRSQNIKNRKTMEN